VEDDEVCTELVGLLREIGGDVLNRAADAFDSYQGGMFHFVDRGTLDPNGAVNAAVQRNGDVFFASDLLKGDLAVTAVHESRHLPTDVSGAFGHGEVPERYFYDAEYQAYQSLPNPGPYAATRSFFRLRNSYPGLQLIRPLPPGR